MFSARNFHLFTFIVAVFSIFAGRSLGAEDAAFGPLYQEFKLTLTPGERTEAVSPLYYHEKQLSEPDNLTRTWAAPPVFSYVLNEDVDYAQFDLFWKVLTYDRFGAEYRFQLVQWISFSGGKTQSDTNVSRFTLFPVYFQQRSPVPEKNYTALFPIYGQIKERFFRSDIKFVLFPLYGQTVKRDVVTDNYLWPVFHLRHGSGVSGWQFWPLIGEERKAPVTATNAWGDLEPVGGFYKFFALWPMFWLNEAGMGTTNQMVQQAVLPLYTFLRSPLRDSTTYFWPLGVTHTIDREKRYDEWGAPWPLIVFTRGEGKTVNRVFPFFNEAHNPALTGRWYAWPIYKYNRLHSPPLDRERARILFFLYSDTKVKDTRTGNSQRQIDCWPLFTSRRDLDGRSRLQILAPLEPILPNSSGVERDLSPLWSLWRSERNARTGANSQSLLWNLYRRDATPQTRKCSLLFGLFQYQSAPQGKRWRVFFVPFGKTRKPAQPAQP